MPFCNKCGKEYTTGDSFCKGCGNRLSVPEQPPVRQDFTPPVYQSAPEGYTPPAPQPEYQPQYQPEYQPAVSPAPQPSMKWFKFLIMFALWAAAVLNLVNAVLYLTGFSYEIAGASAWMVYGVFAGLQAVDIIYGILLVGVAALCVITRFKLAKFKADGPKFLTILYIINIALAVIYTVIASIIIEYFGASDLVSGVIPPLVMLLINRAYFKKRAHLFVN